jgi:hypothetical protein
MKKIISMFLAVMMVLGGLPMGELVAWAEETPAVVDNVTVTKTYKDLNQIEIMYIEIKGTNLGKLGKNPVIVRDQSGNPTALTTIVENEFRLYYKIENPKGIAKISVNADDYNIGEVSMPQISNINPINRMVSSGGTLKILGDGFKNDKISVNFYNGSGTLDEYGKTVTPAEITKEFLANTVGGPYRVEFKYTDTAKKLTIEDNYPNLFTVYGRLGLSDDITMFPNQGPTGTEVKIKGKELTKDMSVFFLKETDGSDLYTVDNRGSFVSFGKDVEKDNENKNTIDVYTVKVPPKLEQGRYFVVLTNDVNKETNLEGKITSTQVFPNNIFTVVNSSNAVTVSDLTPSKGPETGIDAILQGRYIGTLSGNIFTPEEGIVPIAEKPTPASTELKVKYGKDDGEVIGKYKLIGKDGVDVVYIERDIEVFIAGKATFREGSSFSEGLDKINIKVPSTSLQDGEDPAKEVKVVVKTTIKYKEGEEIKIATVEEEGKWKNKFIYEPINFKPKITTIVPDRIPVDSNNKIAESFKISIIGENFVKYRYTDKDGSMLTKQPVINIADQLILDPNIKGLSGGTRISVDDMKVFNRNGVEIDGTLGNDLGNKITVTIPKGISIDSSIIDIISRLKVTNPIKSDEEITKEEPDKHMGLAAEGDIRFVKVTSDKTPSILNVYPDSITTEGRAGIIIQGENFSEKFNLYMDGEKINGAKRNGVGTEIVFDAPPKSEGYVQLIVQNDNGAIAVFDKFLYVKTYTNPKIIDFNPKKGSANTLVDLKGENLVPPNPFVKDISGLGLMKLVGTRVFMDGKDINTYNPNGLVDYNTLKNDMNMIEADGNRIVPSDYYHSIILEENGIYYKIYFDTNSGEYILTNGDTDIYTLSADEEKLYGKKAGKEKEELDVNSTEITIGGKILSIKTPYEVKDGKITGNRVMVKNNNELHFIVPPQPREGFYDVAIVNPDTNRDERKGSAGFYYNFQPQEFPKIEKIEPSEGSTEGQYNIFITGKGFFDRGGDQKTSVTIGGVVVPSKDIIVSPDGNTLTVKVPKYPGDLSTETDMDRKYVNVTVTNPGGGSDSKINGFAYIIPISHPKITTLILNKGTAAGGETVTIEGSDFRYFEPFRDINNNGVWDEGEPFTDKNNNGKWDDLRDGNVFNELKSDWDKNILPILPTVYFGGKVAKIKSFTTSSIDIETPKGIKGSIPVYLVNNDYGVSNTLMFNYESSNPKITSITPSTGRKQGKDKVEILGEGFGTSGVLVQFGRLSDKNISNSTIALAEPNSGRIRDKLSTIKVGNLTVKYDATKDSKTLSFSIEENKVIYGPVEIDDYKDNEIFFDLSSLKDDKGVGYSGHEEVRVQMERIEGANSTSRVRVDRGFSPKVNLVNSKQVIVETPSYYTIGNVPVTLTNPDGGTATTNFNYKNPDSTPTITNIKKDGEEGYKVDDGRIIVDVIYSGGNVIEVTGTDFRKPVKISIGDFIINSKIEYDPENESVATKLTFEMPPMSEKYIGEYLRLVVENEDGGYASSEPRFIHITKPESTGLEITKVTPNFGPTAGGTTVTIEGKDFRKTMDGLPGKELKVYFGRGKDQVIVPASDIISVSFDKIVLKTPPFTAGLADIKVENPDGNIVILKDGFNYVSNPRITSVVNLDNDKFVIETISIEGGEKIKIIGSDFMEGARVVFNPVLKLVEDDKQATGDIITIDDKKYILESGVEGTEVERINGQTITVITPPGKLGEKGVIVINPDKGATNIYNIVYGIPEIGAPFNVRAEVVFDQFIRVNWTGVKDATQYEIYMSEDGGKFEFIDTTELTSYAVQKLKPNRKYQFLVKAMGKYGTSKPIEESKSNIVKTGSDIGPIDNDGKPAEKTEIKVNGTNADIIIGSMDFTTKGMVIDLTRGNLVGVKDITIRIPASVVSSSLGKIQVIGKDYKMEFTPSIFKTSTIEDNKSRSNAGVVFKIAAHNDNIDVQAGNTIVGGKYNLEAVVYVDKDLSKMDYINGRLNFTLDQNPLIIKNRRLTNIKTVRYDNSSKTWVEATVPNRLGLYTVIGSRR